MLGAGATCDLELPARAPLGSRQYGDAADRCQRGPGEAPVSTHERPRGWLSGSHPAIELVSLAERICVEKERIFCRDWICVGREEELRNPARSLARYPRGSSFWCATARLGCALLQCVPAPWYAPCRSRAAGPRGVQLPGGIAASRITCPYHSGPTTSTPADLRTPSEQQPNSTRHVQPVPGGVEAWGGFVFLNLTPSRAVHCSRQLAAIPRPWRATP